MRYNVPHKVTDRIHRIINKNIFFHKITMEQ